MNELSSEGMIDFGRNMKVHRSHLCWDKAFSVISRMLNS